MGEWHADTVHAEYPQHVSFWGAGGSSGMIYYGLAWHREDHDAEPCPLVIHFETGDVAAADLADPDRLLARGWAPPTDPHGELAMAFPQARIFERWEAGYSASVTYTRGGATCVALTVTKREACIAVSIQGRRVSLPASEEDLIRALGAPTTRKLGLGGK
jgi:hypothetical protein